MFTEAGRVALRMGRLEAHRLGAKHLGAEHLLLGILDEGHSAAALGLKEFSLDADKLRAQLGDSGATGADPTIVLGELLFSQRARAAIQVAGELSRKLQSDGIAPEHLLLALLKGGEGMACQILRSLGVSLEQVRRRVLDRMATSGTAQV